MKRSMIAVALGSAAVAAAARLASPWHRRWGATDEEIVAPLPGDELVEEPALQATRAVTIQAPPSAVWPWLVQLGADRGGFYSYDWLENLFRLGIHSADEIVPEWQRREPGELVYADAAGTGGWYVMEARPDEVLVLKMADVPEGRPMRRDEGLGWEFLWTFALRERPDGSTRLLVRERTAFTRPVGRALLAPLGPVSFVMTERMLRGIKARAEATATVPGTVRVAVEEGSMPAHLAVPTGDGPWPGVVVVHDALGMTTDLRRQAEWLAGHGYLALAPDLYHRGGRARCLFETMRALGEGEGRAFDDIEAARRALAERDDCTGRVGVIGFCMGGGYAMATAAKGSFDSASVNYGTVSDEVLEDLSRCCPVVASYGADDRSLQDAPARLDAGLAEAGVDHEVTVHLGAGHGFLNDHEPDDEPRWALFAGCFANTGYVPEAAEAARAQILAFFDRHLAQPAATP